MGISSTNQKNNSWSDIEETLRRSHSLAAAGQYAAAVMHEINNPLEAITNLAYLIQEEADDAEQVRRYTGLLQEQLVTVAEIAHQTLSFHRSAQTYRDVDVGELSEAALRVYGWKIAAKKIRLLKEFAKDSTVKAHAGELLQVMTNLIANAVDALPVNGTLWLRVQHSEDQVHMTIADDGHGIPQSLREKIFDPFFTTKDERGTGLGLAISKSIIERHAGRIQSRSSTRAGKSGTTFRISLPRKSQEASAG